MRAGERLADVAHELRTPLNAIKTWTHVLEERLGDGDPEVRRALSGILRGIDEQARLIGELLERPAPP